MTKQGDVHLLINIDLLIEQKQALMRAMDAGSEEDRVLLNGVLAVLDTIHDTLDPPEV